MESVGVWMCAVEWGESRGFAGEAGCRRAVLVLSIVHAAV